MIRRYRSLPFSKKISMTYKEGQYFTTDLFLKESVYNLILNDPEIILEPSVGRGDLIEHIIKAKQGWDLRSCFERNDRRDRYKNNQGSEIRAELLVSPVPCLRTISSSFLSGRGEACLCFRSMLQGLTYLVTIPIRALLHIECFYKTLQQGEMVGALKH